MNKQNFLSYLEARIESNNKALASLVSAQERESSVDEIAALKTQISVVKHRLRFLSVLNSAADDIASIVSQCKISAEMLSEVEKDAKSLAKVTELFSALADKRMISVSSDDALAQAVDYLVETSFKELSHDALRIQLKSKKSNFTESHITDRQASMICKMFERLNIAERTRVNDKKATKFNTDSAIVKRLIENYAS